MFPGLRAVEYGYDAGGNCTAVAGAAPLYAVQYVRDALGRITAHE